MSLPNLGYVDDFSKRMQAINNMKNEIDTNFKNIRTKAVISTKRRNNYSNENRKPSIESQFHNEPKQKPYALLKKPPRQTKSRCNEPALLIIKSYPIGASQSDMCSVLRPRLGSVSSRNSPLISSTPNFPSHTERYR